MSNKHKLNLPKQTMDTIDLLDPRVYFNQEIIFQPSKQLQLRADETIRPCNNLKLIGSLRSSQLTELVFDEQYHVISFQWNNNDLSRFCTTLILWCLSILTIMLIVSIIVDMGDYMRRVCCAAEQSNAEEWTNKNVVSECSDSIKVVGVTTVGILAV